MSGLNPCFLPVMVLAKTSIDGIEFHSRLVGPLLSELVVYSISVVLSPPHRWHSHHQDFDLYWKAGAWYGSSLFGWFSFDRMACFRNSHDLAGHSGNKLACCPPQRGLLTRGGRQWQTAKPRLSPRMSWVFRNFQQWIPPLCLAICALYILF